MENPVKKEPSIDQVRAVYEFMGCSVLAKNMALICEHNLSLVNFVLNNEVNSLDFDLKGLIQNRPDILEHITKENSHLVLEKLHSFEVYDASYDDLANKYKFPSPIKKELKCFLNLAAINYLSFTGQVWLKKILPVIEKEIEQLTKAAERLSYYLKPMTLWDENYNQFFDNQPVHKLINETNSNLTEIMSLKEKLRGSVIGQLAKLGDHRPLGNLGLHEFIKIMWDFWHNFLGRTIVQKNDGINGRKQFLEFLGDCLEPVHPKLVEEHFIDGPIDNALKKFQRSQK